MSRPDRPGRTGVVPHAAWVRVCHWVGTASIVTLAFTGFVILMAHPRLYWGEVGNNLTPALLELPISRNHQHGGWEGRAAFFDGDGAPVTAVRTYDIFNQNGWGRSLHFLSGWILVATGLAYLVSGVFTGHLRRDVVPGATELDPRYLVRDLRDHLHLRVRQATGGPDYGVLQKWAYTMVVLGAVPLLVITGLAMSPAVTAGYPFLSSMFGGSQSARTIHFGLFAALVLFLLVHLLMVSLSGFARQMRGMILGE